MPKEKEKGPKPVEIAIAAVLSAILGVVGAFVYLALQPLEKVNDIPSAEDRSLGRVYFVEGRGGNVAHDTWQAKEAAVSNSRSGRLSLAEQELNRWAGQRLGGSTVDDLPVISIEPDRPNFRLAEDRIFITVPMKWSAFGMEKTLDSLVSGRFVNQRGVHTLDYEKIYIGSCRLPGPLARRLFNDVVDAYSVSDSLRQGWANLQAVSIDGDTLQLVIP